MVKYIPTLGNLAVLTKDKNDTRVRAGNCPHAFNKKMDEKVQIYCSDCKHLNWEAWCWRHGKYASRVCKEFECRYEVDDKRYYKQP